MKITLNVNELLIKNEQLEKENKELKERVMSKILSDNTEIMHLNIYISLLEKEIHSLKIRLTG